MEFSVDTVQVLLYGALRKPHFFSNFPVAEPGSGELGYGPLVVCETFRPLGVFCFGKHRLFQLVCKLQDLFDKRPVCHEKDLPQQRADPGRIFCNGNTSLKYYRRYNEPLLGRPAVVLPSTSPANAAWSLQRLAEAWRVIL